MFTITLTVCEQQEVEDILHALSEAEEAGLIDFPFQTQTREMTSVEESGWRKDTLDSIHRKLAARRDTAEQFENESRN